MQNQQIDSPIGLVSQVAKTSCMRDPSGSRIGYKHQSSAPCFLSQIVTFFTIRVAPQLGFFDYKAASQGNNSHDDSTSPGFGPASQPQPPISLASQQDARHRRSRGGQGNLKYEPSTGRLPDGSHNHRDHADDYELQELPSRGQTPATASLESATDTSNEKLDSRAAKRRWLEEQDEMKFSHSIQFNAVPDWSSHYIAYSNLKKLIYQLEKSINQSIGTDAESRPLIGNDEDPEKVFTRALDVELEKISSFFAVKEQELLDEVNSLLKDIGDSEDEDEGSPSRLVTHDPTQSASALVETRRHSMHSHQSTEDGGEDDSDDASNDDENTPALARKRRVSFGRRRTIGATGNGAVTDMTASAELTRSRRQSTVAFDDYAEQAALYSSDIMLKRRVVALYVQLCELKSYIQLNKTGFRKVLKKFDKICNRSLRQKYMEKVVESAPPFVPEATKAVEDNVSKMEHAYANLVTKGDIDIARRDLRSHLREHVVWERNTVWRDMIGMERRAEAASLGRALLGGDIATGAARLQGDEENAIPTKEIATPIGRFKLPTWLVSTSLLNLVIILAVFTALLVLPIMESPEQQNCLAILVFASMMWATEAIPLFVTSLTIPFLCIILRVVRSDDGTKRLSSKDATTMVFSSMWTPVIMLLLGGFTLAAALSKCRIDKRIATFVLSKAGTQPRTVLIANMLVSAFASMLISNVAAPVLCYGIIEPMLRNLPTGSPMSKALIMGIALSANIGGMLSPIASPQNVVAIGIMTPEPTWGDWFFIVIPVGLVSLALIWVLLMVTFQPGKGTKIVPIRPVREPFSSVQWFVSIVTISTIALWCASHQLEGVFGDMGVIAIIPLILFFGIGLLTKEDFNNFPWTIIILAAGGLALGKSVRSSGLLHTLANDITGRVEGMSLYGVLVVFSALILVIATFISHTVAALIFLPLVYDVGAAMEEPHPNLLVMAGVLMCSAAMGLPTSGFPNMTAIMKEDATGQRYLQVKHFISRGVPSSILTLIVSVTLGYGAMRIIGM
ncbi:hypothetical protein PoMZ_11006 [Pyricularia oryzae]|uniref:SPX domain-containing protein n=1 Tax=Pyricularia oryzae TaxID=318829 RepID=A0A4P7NJ98_PYROR|nr:hypothetical protein PoMZ_11006 [Pyricularia oryzae]